jgi:uncharacterized membrane protein
MAEQPDVLVVEAEDLAAALGEGLADLTRAPGYALFFGGIYVLGGWLIWYALTGQGALWWSLVAAAGFPILGPFVACGFYEISRRLDRGETYTPMDILGVIFRQKDRQIPSMAAVVVMFFLFWNFLAHMIFALFLGTATLTNVTSSLSIFTTPEGMTMLVVGTAIGAVFSLLLFSITVVSLPMLLDREVDFVTAMITSVHVVRQSPAVMLGWGVFIALCLFLSMLPWFLGLFVTLPLFGHASWHLYRRVIAWEPA